MVLFTRQICQYRKNLDFETNSKLNMIKFTRKKDGEKIIWNVFAKYDYFESMISAYCSNRLRD